MAGVELGLIIATIFSLIETLKYYFKFAYGSFFKPHTGDGSGNQQDALESFYAYQADAYDATRTALLKGRDDLIRLVAAQLKYEGSKKKPVWVDIGGGTGWNIEQMGKHVDVPSFFETIYLVDLTPSLLKVAQTRFDKLGWKNVKVVCMDCRYFDLTKLSAKRHTGADLITMSYSLTMIPDFFPVIDRIASLLNKSGIIGIVDFYAQTEVEFMRRDYVGGFLDRHCTWLNRTFWRTWFEQDRVMFDGGRRDYLEYRFGTRVSLNKRNAMLPGLRIPFYIWIGCNKNDSFDHLDNSVVRTAFVAAPEGLSRPDVPLPSVYYQNQGCRTYYPDRVLEKEEDHAAGALADGFELLLSKVSLGTDQVALVPSGSGDMALTLLAGHPEIKQLHAYHPNAACNHLLELKLTILKVLTPKELQELTTTHRHGVFFRNLLIDRLSPLLSSQALQYWLNHGPNGWLSNSCPVAPLESLATLKDLSQPLDPDAGDRVRIHTASFDEVLSRANPGSFTFIVLGHIDSLLGSRTQMEKMVRRLNQALAVDGAVMLEPAERAAGDVPIFESLGFKNTGFGFKFWMYRKVKDLE